MEAASAVGESAQRLIEVRKSENAPICNAD